MKLTTILIFIVGLSCSYASVYSQHTKLDLNVKQTTVKDVLKLIEDQSKFSFMYNASRIDVYRKVDINVEKSSVEDIVKQLFAGEDVSYRIIDRNIIISSNSDLGGVKFEEQQQKSVSGKVTDSSGLPLPGVSILVKGTTTGMITDAEGNYSITDIPGNATLVFSFIGMKTQEIIVNRESEIDVTMLEDAVGIEEVVAIGYGTQRRSLVTNSISKVKVGDENMRTVLSPTQLLEGRVAGVITSLGSGNLGSSERVRIRGASSLSASNEPLYVVDGIPITNSNAAIFNLGENMSSLSVLNLSDIESIDILKDAASAAIYGSRGTNGVIVITTRSGKEGKSDLRINIGSGVSQFARKDKIKFSNSNLWLKVYNEGVDNFNMQNGNKVGDSGYMVHMENPFFDLPDMDWLRAITQIGVNRNIDMSFSGGKEKNTYYIGSNYTHQEGVIKTNAVNKYNLMAKVNAELFPWLEVGSNNSANYLRNNQVPGADIGSTIVARALEQRPFDRPYKPNGEYYLGGTDQLRRHNPVQILNEQKAYFDNLRYIGSFYAQAKFLKKVTFKTSLSADVSYTYDYINYNQNHPYGTGVGRIVENTRLLSNLLFENILTYSEKIGSVDLNVMGGHSFEKTNNRGNMIDGRGFPSPSYDVLSVASEIYEASGYLSEYALESYFGRVSLSYKDKYIFNSTLRTDGSSNFSPTNRWGLFPSVSLGWNISKESFMASTNTDLKFRMSFGKTGNQSGIGSYAWQPLMSGGRNYDTLSGIAVSSFGNPDLTWETADQYDAGFDVGLWNGKVNFRIDYYLKNTNRLLYNKPVQATSGVSSITSNIGSLRNSGLEFSLNSHFKLGAVNWNSQFNIATNKNKIVKLTNDETQIPIGNNRILEVGNELGAFYLFKMDGIFQYDGEVPQGQYDLGVRAGDIKWKDLDGNNIINDNDRVITGSSNPDFYGGWNNTFKYEGFQLDIFTTFMYGNDVYAQWKALGTGWIGYYNANLKSIVSNRWTGPGTSNKYPRSITGYSHNNKNSDMWLEDGSFFRLRTLTLSYNFNLPSLKKTGMKSLRVFAQADNLALLTDYSGWDPEVSTNLDPRYFGVDNFSVPQPITISLGANINF